MSDNPSYATVLFVDDSLSISQSDFEFRLCVMSYFEFYFEKQNQMNKIVFVLTQTHNMKIKTLHVQTN